ncbi:DUF6364 family protein [Xylophilus sp. GW821-FHT01B05]
MNTKLTLRLDEELIESAKTYAAEHGRSLSQLVADYFAALAVRQSPADSQEAGVTPITDGLVGLLKTAKQPPEALADDGYYQHIRAKHLHGSVR